MRRLMDMMESYDFNKIQRATRQIYCFNFQLTTNCNLASINNINPRYKSICRVSVKYEVFKKNNDSLLELSTAIPPH